MLTFKYYLTLLFLFSLCIIFAQGKITERVLFVGTFGVSENEKVKYFLESERITWINPSGSIFSITNDPSLIESELETTGNSSNEPSSWNCWFSFRSGYVPVITYGFYKITNNKNSNLYFYLDTRDCRWGGGLPTMYTPDIFIKFDFQENLLSYSVNRFDWITFLPGSTLKVWEIKNQGLPITNFFEPPSVKEFNINYDNNGHPILTWICEDFYTNFSIERKVENGNWTHIGQSYETNFIDKDITWFWGNDSLNIQYSRMDY